MTAGGQHLREGYTGGLVVKSSWFHVGPAEVDPFWPLTAERPTSSVAATPILSKVRPIAICVSSRRTLLRKESDNATESDLT